MTVPWQCTVQAMSGMSAMFSLDDRFNLPLYQLTGQSISHYSFLTMSSWLRFTRYGNKFSPSDIMAGFFSRAANIVNLFFLPLMQLRYLIPFHTLIRLLFIFISSSTPNHPLPTLPPLCYYSLFSRAVLKQALPV